MIKDLMWCKLEKLRMATLIALFSLIAPDQSALADADIVVSQIYGGGGNSGAAFRNDFIELFNRSGQTIDLTDWTIQYASSAGMSWQSHALSLQIFPGHYALIQLGSGGLNGQPLPTPDSTGTINLSATAGKVALVNSTSTLSGTCPVDEAIVDFVGYGTAATCFEGALPAPAAANALAIFRASAGCLDTDNNISDFFASAPAPRNRLSATNACNPPVAFPLHVIQGSAVRSPLVGEFVMTTTNIVTGIRNNGFFLQTKDKENDDDDSTSEALFVSSPSEIPAAVAIGNAVVVEGIIAEFRPRNDLFVPPRTQLINATVSLIAIGQPLPAPITLTSAMLDPSGGLEQLERFESMRVRINTMIVSSATEGFIIESSASGISDGVFYGVLPGILRPMREPGISIFDPLPATAPIGVPRFDANVERLRVDSNAQPGAPRIEVTTGAVVSGLVGVLDLEQRIWTLLPDAASPPVVSGNIAAKPVPAAASNEFTVASFNLERFFDTTDDPFVRETVLTTTAFKGRLNKASLAIRNVLRAPDILGVVEVENLAALQTLADRLNTDALVEGQPQLSYQAWLEEGNDIGGIDSGFLVNTARISVVTVTQVGKEATYTNPANGQSTILNDRPPLVLSTTVPRPGSTNPLHVIVILSHLRSLSGIDDATDGSRIRAKRLAQAEYLASLVQERQNATPPQNLVLIGDFNAFQFSDGYVDVIGTIKGTPSPSDEVTLTGDDLVDPDLVNLTDELPAVERYSFSFDGNAQALDHILVNAPMRARLVRYAYARNNVDFPESLRSNVNRPERISDHDAPVAWFALSTAPRILSLAVSDTGAELRWNAEPWQTNRVEASTDLDEWIPLKTVVCDENGEAVFREAGADSTKPRFYRVTSP